MLATICTPSQRNNSVNMILTGCELRALVVVELAAGWDMKSQEIFDTVDTSTEDYHETESCCCAERIWASRSMMSDLVLSSSFHLFVTASSLLSKWVRPRLEYWKAPSASGQSRFPPKNSCTLAASCAALLARCTTKWLSICWYESLLWVSGLEYLL